MVRYPQLSSKLRNDRTAVAVQHDILRGISEALTGRRNAPTPVGWDEVYQKLSKSKDNEVRERVAELSVIFGNAEALATLTRTITDAKAPSDTRTRALQILLDKRADGIAAMLPALLDDASMRQAVLRALSHYDDPKTPSLILDRYAKLTDVEKADAISTLASRPGYALALLDAVEKKLVPRAEVTPFIARQLVSMKNKRVSERLNAVWGTIRPAAKDKDKLLSRYKALATPEQVQNADLSAGRVVWAKTCASCHMLFGEGGKIGPDLTGSQRAKPEYILEKVLDPNAVVPREYQTVKVVSLRGRVLTGIVKQENEKVLTLQTATEEVRIAKSDIEEREQQRTSLMPEGQLAMLKDTEIRDLLAYLAGAGCRGSSVARRVTLGSHPPTAPTDLGMRF
jgi:putative heme-binding domain-containing protein